MQTVKFTGHSGLRLTGNLHSQASRDSRSDCVIICHDFRGGKEGSKIFKEVIPWDGKLR